MNKNYKKNNIRRIFTAVGDTATAIADTVGNTAGLVSEVVGPNLRKSVSKIQEQMLVGVEMDLQDKRMEAELNLVSNQFENIKAIVELGSELNIDESVLESVMQDAKGHFDQLLKAES